MTTASVPPVTDTAQPGSLQLCTTSTLRGKRAAEKQPAINWMATRGLLSYTP